MADHGMKKELFSSLYALLCVGVLSIEESRADDLNREKERLNYIYDFIKDKKAYEIFGVSETADLQQISASYKELSKSFHPDRVPENSPKEISELYSKIFVHIGESYKSIKIDSKGVLYDKKQEVVALKKLLESENKMNKCKVFLKKRQHKKALELLLEIEKSNAPPNDYMVYMIWSKLGLYFDQPREHLHLAREVQRDIAKIPYEERHSTYYFFIKGLFSKMKREYDVATTHFKRALELNPDFVEAEMELENIETMDRKSFSVRTILDKDLKTLVQKVLKK